jgi:cellulose synthase/poly-beta-1,6-N-acetylglucosamine synthase-like glycosyltransferase
MLAVFYIACVFIVLYGVLLLFFLWGIVKTTPYTDEKHSLHLSIVVPFRNETEVLYGSISDFNHIRNRYPDVEVIFVNDHSVDLKEYQLDALFEHTNLILVHAPDKVRGKKAALKFGIEVAVGTWILTVDADTRLNPDALEELIANGLGETSCAVVPVKPRRSTGLMRGFFDLEFMVLQAVTVASVRFRMPLLASGAALLVKKASYLKGADIRDDWHIPSGDDVFALFSIAKREGNASISSFVPAKPLAEAQFPSDVAALFLQRMRWIGKTPKVENTWYSIVSWLVLIANLSFIVIWTLDVIMGDWKTAIIFSTVKWVPEIALMTWGVLYFRRLDVLPYMLIGLIFYPFYLLSLVSASAFFTPKWRE